MNLKQNDPRTRKFATNVGLITTTGADGDNVMSAEWTHHLSYSPALIGVCLYTGEQTYQNILETKCFGVNLCADNQNVASSVSGNYSGKTVDKIELLKSLGIEFYPGKKIKAQMIQGAAMNAECELVKVVELGDHTMFVGEVVEISAPEVAAPLLLHNGRYWHLGEPIPKPEAARMAEIATLAENLHRGNK